MRKTIIFFLLTGLMFSGLQAGGLDSLFRNIYEKPVMATGENSNVFSNALLATINETTVSFNKELISKLKQINGLSVYYFDKNFLLINWGVPEENGTVSYRGALWVWNEAKKNYKVQILNDISSYQTFPEKEIYSTENWWGALYYQCIAEGDYYTLLGWNSSQPLYSQKVIETMRVKSDGSVEFGLPVFTNQQGVLMRKFNVDAASTEYYVLERRYAKSKKTATTEEVVNSDFDESTLNPDGSTSSTKKPLRRIIFKFSRKQDMILRYDYQSYVDKSGTKEKQRKENLIVFDRILPRDASLGGQASNYVPEGGVYDGFRFENGKWKLVLNVIARNPNPKPNKKQAIRNKIVKQ
ncbi:MAG: hypothetical protein LBR45_00650 [Bacteroidales bacterium]|jgi:hypothetical protein|nr:hypothetical protein [Bacteroidales bacterium]